MGAMGGRLLVDAGCFHGGSAALVVVRMNLGANFALGCPGIVVIVRIEHGDNSHRASAVAPGPVALDQHALNVLPVQRVGFRFAGQQRGITIGGIVIDSAEEVGELFEIDAHLEDQLAEGHLLRAGQLVELAAIGARVVDGLNGRDAQELRGFLFGEVGREVVGPNLALEISLAPCRQIVVELVEYGLKSLRIESGRLPKLGAGRLEERSGIERIGLRVISNGKIEAETGANQRAAGFGIGISGKHPAFMLGVAKRAHQAPEVELDVGVLEVEQRLERRGDARSDCQQELGLIFQGQILGSNSVNRR